MIRYIRRGWDRVALYLPIIIMGMMALGTYWLIRSTPAVEGAPGEQVIRRDPDYLMERFYIKTFDENGRLKSEIYGEQARHFPHTEILEIEQVRIRSFNQRGHQTIATAHRALANNDASEVQLIGDALVVRKPVTEKNGRQLPEVSFSGEFLHAFLTDERIKSHKPVTLRRGEDIITAESLDYSNFDQMLELRGRVRGTLQPPAKR